MASLYSYIVRIDDGAAPNPFNGMCSLAICKPAIRRTAKVGDWIVGLGAIAPPSGTDLSGRVVYAMRVGEILTLREYDSFAKQRWPYRIPDIRSAELSRKLGDCIYDYSEGGESPKLRPSVHTAANMATDLSGEKVLLSWEYFYFGREAICLPEELHPIIHQGQGHRRPSNDDYLDSFVEWIQNCGYEIGMHGWPDCRVVFNENGGCGHCADRQSDDEQDQAIDET